MNKTLTLKNMVETYVNFSGDQRELDKMWDAYYQMACVGFIDNVTWGKFSALCHGWFFDQDDCAILDSSDDNYLERHGSYKLIWQYVPYAEYTYHR